MGDIHINIFSMIFQVQICYRSCTCIQIPTPTPPPPPPQYCIPGAKCRSNPVDDCGKYGRCTAPPGLMGATG